MSALLCPNCGGPLPPSVKEVPVVACVYCRTTSNAQGVVLELHRTLPEDSQPPADEWKNTSVGKALRAAPWQYTNRR